LLSEVQDLLKTAPPLSSEVDSLVNLLLQGIDSYDIRDLKNIKSKKFNRCLVSLGDLLRGMENMFFAASASDLKQLDNELKPMKEQTKAFFASEKFKAIALSLGSGAALLYATPLVLGLVGFTATGVKAGSLAAIWMSMTGAVGSGSLFAILQSVGAAGLGLASGGVLAAGAAAATLYTFWPEPESKENTVQK
jgi:hypothetical protein